jgi:type IV pilus assembly protein PilV
MLSIAVIAVGAAGVMSMQRGAVVGDAESRRMDIAVSIAHTWIERLRRDGMIWTGPNAYTATSNFAASGTLSASNVTPSASGGWVQPAIPVSYASADGLSPMFDALGRDLIEADGANAMYCVLVKVDPIVDNGNYSSPPLSGTAAPLELVRETVMVFWPRQLSWTGTTPTPCAGFSGDPVQIEATNPGTYHFVFATTGIMKNLL